MDSLGSFGNKFECCVGTHLDSVFLWQRVFSGGPSLVTAAEDRIFASSQRTWRLNVDKMRSVSERNGCSFAGTTHRGSIRKKSNSIFLLTAQHPGASSHVRHPGTHQQHSFHAVRAARLPILPGPFYFTFSHIKT